MPFANKEKRNEYRKLYRQKNIDKLRQDKADYYWNIIRPQRLALQGKEHLINETKEDKKARTKKNKKAYKKLYNQQLIEKNKAYCWKYKQDHGCCSCPENHPAALTFHHVRGKDADVHKLYDRSHQRLLREIEKCEVRCFNCHMKLHWAERQSKESLIPPDPN